MGADYGRTLAISGDPTADGATLGGAQQTIVRGHTDSHQRCASADQAHSPLAGLQRSEAATVCARMDAHENTTGRDVAAEATSAGDGGVPLEKAPTDCVPSECSSRRMRKMHRS